MPGPTPRIRARLALSAALQVVPLPWAERVRRLHSRGGATARSLRPVLSVLRHRPLRDIETFEMVDRPGMRLAGTDSLMVRRLYWYGEGGYEGAELHWWREFCAGAQRITEMGANVGFYTVHAGLAAPHATITAVEPHPDSAAVIRTNLRLNGVTNVTVVEAAVVGEVVDPTIELLLPDAEQYESPTGAYVPGAEVADRPAGRAVTVPAIEAKDLGSGRDLLKLDIEGMEADVLDAVRDEVATSRPVIFLEVIRSAARLRALMAKWHDELDYVVFAIGHESLHLVPGRQLHSPEMLPRYGTRDVILVPQERVADV